MWLCCLCIDIANTHTSVYPSVSISQEAAATAQAKGAAEDGAGSSLPQSPGACVWGCVARLCGEAGLDEGDEDEMEVATPVEHQVCTVRRVCRWCVCVHRKRCGRVCGSSVSNRQHQQDDDPITTEHHKTTSGCVWNTNETNPAITQNKTTPHNPPTARPRLPPRRHPARGRRAVHGHAPLPRLRQRVRAAAPGPGPLPPVHQQVYSRPRRPGALLGWWWWWWWWWWAVLWCGVDWSWGWVGSRLLTTETTA